MLTKKLSPKKELSVETESTEHPYQVNLANYESKAIRELFDMPDAPNSQVGQALYIYAIEKKLEETEYKGTVSEYIASYKTK